MPPIAYNINSDTDNLENCQQHYKIIRGSGGGYKYCKAIGYAGKTATLLRFPSTWSIWKNSHSIVSFETVRFEAKRHELESSAQSSVWPSQGF